MGSLTVPKRTTPCAAPRSCAAAERMRLADASVRSASSSSRVPASVGTMPRGVRSNSFTPSSSSSALSCALTAGGLVNTRSAARVRFPSCAMATKVFSW